MASELTKELAEVQKCSIHSTSCMCAILASDVQTLIHSRISMYVRKGERERERGRGPRGMEKPILSYQRKWLLADRKKRLHSPQKTIIINVYDWRASNWNARAEGSYNPPLLRAIFQYPSLHFPRIESAPPLSLFFVGGK